MKHTKDMRELLKSIDKALQMEYLLAATDAEIMRFTKRVTHVANSLGIYTNYDGFNHYVASFQDKAAQYMVDVEAALKALRITKERIEVHLGLDGSDTRQG